ncbi:glutamate decarboxylase [Tautonia plasticadhaerens]|uniref:Glutamate decarboxylase n=1 Tax=Tautonia plasticadhaerens TaxID=2527974 RepID=A0A518H2W7_9BACT|nr:glutamate decarboxylase [Tautonia plasticadhaerens]QDV35178.1 Glutamate decarboxylase [Tautonia plasticadhaerens]
MRRIRHGEDRLAPAYASRDFSRPVPRDRIPDRGMPADVAHQMIRDELQLDGNPALNLASFVTTWMEPEADALAAEALNKNLIDQDEYPRTDEIHRRVVSMVGRLFHAPEAETPVGSCTVGSSEAIMLGMLAHKFAWRNRRKAAGLPADRPNVVFGADVHTCWEKFALYFDVEARIAPLSADCHILTPEAVEARVDENTIGVGCVLGTTFTGQVDKIAEIDALLDRVQAEKGWDIPIHVDAASGGFVVPFHDPGFAWDFRLGRVRSINVSNHKYGLVYPGIGTVVFRDASCLPDELVFKISYLGGEMSNYSLNFSKASNQVLLQYYNFLRLGHEGYARILGNVMENARYLEDRLDRLGRFRRLSDAKSIPIIALTLADPDEPPETLDLVSQILRESGWIVPAYPLPPDAQQIRVLRAVVRENFSRDLAELFADDVEAALARVDRLRPPHPSEPPTGRVQGVC